MIVKLPTLGPVSYTHLTHVTGNEGIVEHDLDRTIDNLCSIASKSMHHIDRQVIEIMVSKPLSLIHI